MATPSTAQGNSSSTTATTSWDGSPKPLAKNQSLRIEQTPANPIVFAALNESASSDGTFMLATGGNPPVPHKAPAGASAPVLVSQSWNAQNLTVTNNSTNDGVIIDVQAIGPNMPGITPAALPISTAVTLKSYGCAQGYSKPNYMWLQMTSTAGLVVLSINGNGAVYNIQLNAGQTTGPSSAEIQPPFQNPSPPDGYYATTTQNTYNFQFNWNGALVFVANLASSQANPANVTLISLS
jgi:hypothetical protein